MRKIRAAMVFPVLFSCCAAFAANPQETKRACFTRAGLKQGEHWLEECIIDVLTLRPFHPVFETLAPGSGFGVGVGFDTTPNSNTNERSFSVKLAGATDHSYSAAGSFTLGFKPIVLSSQPQTAASLPYSNKEKTDHDHYLNKLRLVAGDPEVDAKGLLTFRAQQLDLETQDYYGLGQFTTQSGWSRYALRETSAGVTVGDPLTKWFAPSFSTDFIQPKINPALGQARPPITSVYTDATAPGLAKQPGFVRFEPQALIHFQIPPGKAHGSVSLVPDQTLIKAGYAFYRDIDTAAYSFQQFHATAQTSAELLILTGKTDAKRSLFAKILCPSAPAKECTLGRLYLTADTELSRVGSGSVVPFYFLPTLGGTDFQGEDTLRGFRDYRFRAPDRMFYQAEFRHPLPRIPLGLAAFYDVGRVGTTAGDLTSGHLRHDVGVGAYVTISNVALVRLYLGFGTGEGVRPNLKFPSGLM